MRLCCGSFCHLSIKKKYLFSELEDVTNFVCQFVIINQLIMDFENDAVCEKIINEIDLVFQNDSDLYDLIY